jgi:hypothetical protein
MTPNVFGVAMSRAGGPKLGWFSTLNASIRNSAYVDRPVSKRYLCALTVLLELDLYMIQSRIRHEHRTGQLEQNGRFDHLHVPPQMLDAFAAVAVPTPTGERLDI